MVSEETMKKRKIKDYTNLGGMIHARIISSSEGHLDGNLRPFLITNISKNIGK